MSAGAVASFQIRVKQSADSPNRYERNFTNEVQMSSFLIGLADYPLHFSKSNLDMSISILPTTNRHYPASYLTEQ